MLDVPHEEPEKNSRRQFHDRVAPRDRFLTIPAAPAEEREGEQRHVVPRPDRLPAAGTARAREDNRLSAREARDDDVEKAPEHEAQDKGHPLNECRGSDHRCLPSPRRARSRRATSCMYLLPVASTRFQSRIAIPRFPAFWLEKAAKRSVYSGCPGIRL